MHKCLYKELKSLSRATKYYLVSYIPHNWIIVEIYVRKSVLNSEIKLRKKDDEND